MHGDLDRRGAIQYPQMILMLLLLPKWKMKTRRMIERMIRNEQCERHNLRPIPRHESWVVRYYCWGYRRIVVVAVGSIGERLWEIIPSRRLVPCSVRPRVIPLYAEKMTSSVTGCDDAVVDERDGENENGGRDTARQAMAVVVAMMMNV